MPPAWIIKHPPTHSRVEVLAATRKKALIMAAELLGAPVGELVVSWDSEW